MGLATPTSIMVGTGRAAEFGILFRKGEALQSLRDVDVVATEHGIARLRGRSLRERVKAMVAIAAPEHRDRLLREAREQWGDIG